MLAIELIVDTGATLRSPLDQPGDLRHTCAVCSISESDMAVPPVRIAVSMR
jgi:hypothetical protein